MIKSILLAIDGSVYTDAVLKYGIHLANSFKAKLKVITVIDVRIFEWSVYLGVDGFAPVVPSSSYLEESRRLLDEKAEKVLNKCVEILKKEGIPFTAEKLEGSPVELICEQSRLADLVVLGARGEFAKWGTKLMGATIDAISRECIKPLFISPESYRPIRRILVPYDGSANSNRALPMAGYFAHSLGLPVTVFTVDNDLFHAKEIAEEGKKYLETYDIEVHTDVAKGNAEEQIVSFCAKAQFDLIIMGAYGQSRIRELILGSTTVQVMRKTDVPLVLVK
ncbi:universal stress protein [bacterium]|nr:universal stress protein [bacterium]